MDHLHSYPSEPSTPKLERTYTCLSLVSLLNQFPISATQPPISSPPISPSQEVPSESTPLLDSCSSAPPKKHRRRHTVSVAQVLNHSHGLLPGHHRHESHSRHEHHHIDHPRCVLTRFYESADDEGRASAKLSHVEDHQAGEPQQSLHVHSHSHGHGHHGHGDLEALLERADSDAGSDCTAEEEDAEVTIGRKRQIVGILVRHAHL